MLTAHAATADAGSPGRSTGPSLWPKEHGAYGQISVPLAAALFVGGASPAGVLVVLATVAAFLAHEPLVVLLGLRGARVRRDAQDHAWWWLGWCGVTMVVSGGAAFLLMPPDARLALLAPAVPALVLAVATARGREKSWYGEVAAALAFSGATMPVVLAAGAPLVVATGVAVPFALLFTANTFAVRVVVLRVRGGGDPRTAAVTRGAVYVVAGGAAAVLAVLSTAGWLPWSVLAASAPGLLTALAIVLRPPPAGRLRTLGWTLVAVSLLTLILVAASR